MDPSDQMRLTCPKEYYTCPTCALDEDDRFVQEYTECRTSEPVQKAIEQINDILFVSQEPMVIEAEYTRELLDMRSPEFLELSNRIFPPR